MSGPQMEEKKTYLTFTLGEETFAFPVAHVREVLDLTDVTKVPRTPDFLRGVINLRGSVVPVVDMRIKFGFPSIEDGLDTCIIVVEVEYFGEKTQIGALADSVQEVFDLAAGEIEPPPAFGMRLHAGYIQGMGKRDDRFIIILDTDRVFSEDELILASSVSETNGQDPAEDCSPETAGV